MAEVWKAFDPQLQRYVAIKLLHADLQTDPEFIQRFSREARMIAALHHPNIVQIYDFQTASAPEANAPVAYMVMDYVDGQTLAHYIHSTSRAGKFPPPADIVHLFASISKAIDYAHQQGMIHRDIKPGNILLDKRNTAHNPMGEPVLTDFGIAKIMGVGSGTISGMWLGTPLYVSPEQAQGYPGNERSDIYSLGVILYEICTGVYPFRGESIPVIIAQQVRSAPPAPALINPAIPPALTMVILHAMAKDPAERFSSASAMTAAIAQAFNLPVPTDLFLPVPPLNSMIGPTYLSSSRPGLPSSMAPPDISGSQPVPMRNPTPQIAPAFLATPQFTAFPAREVGSPATPANSTPVSSSPLPPAQGAQTAVPLRSSSNAWTPLPLSSPPPARSRRGWKWLFISVLVVLFLLAGSTIVALNAFIKKPPPPAPTTVGSVIFQSSLQLNPYNSQGVDDEVQLDLHNISAPAPGKSYYAWLKNAPIEDEGSWVLLGTLSVNQGNAQLPQPYQDPHHADLLVNASSFLMTEEDSTVTPVQPSTDRRTWLFYSEPPQVTLLHLRHLLANSPELGIRQLYGGLAIWFWRNTGKIVEWAGAARDDAQNTPLDADAIHRQLIRILDYIDGAGSVSMDVPANTPLLVNAQDAQVALVGPSVTLGPPGTTYKGQIPPGDVYLIRVHLDAAVAAPEATQEQRQLAKQIETGLNQVVSDLQQVRQDARQLIKLNGTQLVTPQALSLLNDMTTMAEDASEGSINPAQPQVGAAGIYSDIQRMATFQVQPYMATR
jgi:serine/threonine protein kinase